MRAIVHACVRACGVLLVRVTVAVTISGRVSNSLVCRCIISKFAGCIRPATSHQVSPEDFFICVHYFIHVFLYFFARLSPRGDKYHLQVTSWWSLEKWRERVMEEAREAWMEGRDRKRRILTQLSIKQQVRRCNYGSVTEGPGPTAAPAHPCSRLVLAPLTASPQRGHTRRQQVKRRQFKTALNAEVEAHLNAEVKAHRVAGAPLDVTRGLVPDTQLRETDGFLRDKLRAHTVGLDDTLGASPVDLALGCHLSPVCVHILGERSETPVARHVHQLTSRELGLALLKESGPAPTHARTTHNRHTHEIRPNQTTTTRSTRAPQYKELQQVPTTQHTRDKSHI